MPGRVAAVALLVAVVVGCVPVAVPAVPSASAASTEAPRATSAPRVTPSPSPTPPPLPHVFVVVMENTSLARALRSSAIDSLATNYRAVSQPSLPNYLALTSGSTWDIADDGYHALRAAGIGAQLDGAGISWRAYMEG